MITVQALWAKPKWLWRAVSLACLALLAGGLFLQHVVGLEPCPMCIVQRYALVLVALSAVIASFCQGPTGRLFWVLMVTLWATAGAYVAARQSWLQWYPPEVQTCGRDFYGMIETFPLKRAIPMIFRGGGDCSQVDWTLLGGSIANWAFVAFACLALTGFISLAQALRAGRLRSVF